MENQSKITGYEKQLIKGLMAMYKAKGFALIAEYMERDLKDITDNRNTDHRNAVETYIETLINK